MNKVKFTFIITILVISCTNNYSIKESDVPDIIEIRYNDGRTESINNVTKAIMFSEFPETMKFYKPKLEKWLLENKEGFDNLQDSPDLRMKTIIGIRLRIAYSMLETDQFKSFLLLNEAENFIFHGGEIGCEYASELNLINKVRNLNLKRISK